jgi:hypothetical protein
MAAAGYEANTAEYGRGGARNSVPENRSSGGTRAPPSSPVTKGWTRPFVAARVAIQNELAIQAAIQELAANYQELSDPTSSSYMRKLYEDERDVDPSFRTDMMRSAGYFASVTKMIDSLERERHAAGIHYVSPDPTQRLTFGGGAHRRTRRTRSRRHHRRTHRRR